MTVFTSRHGLYRFIRMPFGLRNPPGTFQLAMDVILSAVKGQIAFLFLDDIIVFLKFLEEHTVHVRNLLTLPSNPSITLKLKKRRSFAVTIDYLGHAMRLRRLDIVPHTTNVIRELQPPTSSRNSDPSLSFETYFGRSHRTGIA